MIKFGIISFPGTNCENETVRVFKRVGMDAEIVLWNDPGILDGSKLNEFDGYAIPGGFSYEDRGRSGIVASQDPITKILRKEADSGKIIIGICNGAQVLVETGLIPGFDNHALAIALAWNEMKVDGKIVDTGFYNVWSYLKNSAPKDRSAFNNFDELIHVPIAHGEGRFVVDSDVLEKLEANNQILFKYADKEGNVSPDFPTTPNGATASIAALCNPAGNVMAIMPHPERDPRGSGHIIFESIKLWIENNKKADFKPLGDYECKEDIRNKIDMDLEFYVKLIITDNAERTIEEAIVRNGSDIHLDRYLYYGIMLEDGVMATDAIEKIMNSGELANVNKEIPFVKTSDGVFQYDKEKGLISKDLSLSDYVIAVDKGDFVGEAKRDSINLHAGKIIKDIHHGILWNFSEGSEQMDTVIASKVLYNPHSMYLLKV